MSALTLRDTRRRKTSFELRKVSRPGKRMLSRMDGRRLREPEMGEDTVVVPGPEFWLLILSHLPRFLHFILRGCSA